MKTPQHRAGRNLADAGDRSGDWAGEAKAAVRSVTVVIVGKFEEHPAEVSLIEDDDVIEALISDRAHEALGDRIGLW